jgi:RNA polymerase sigma factor (sigma-70 family)
MLLQAEFASGVSPAGESPETEPIFSFGEKIELDEGETLTSLDITEHLERCSAPISVIAFVEASLSPSPLPLDALREKDWNFAALSDEDYSELRRNIPAIKEEIKKLLEESGVTAHWQKYGKGDVVAHKLLVGKHAEDAIITGDTGDWQEAAQKKKNKQKDTRKRTGSISSRPKRDDTDDSIRQYLVEIGRYELLTKDDEAELAQAIEKGIAAQNRLQSEEDLSTDVRHELEQIITDGEAARVRFINANLRLVVSISKRYQKSGLPLLDLVQLGNLGLMHAVEKFDWRKGFKFSTYATWWIRQAAQRGIADTARTIRMPVHAEDSLREINKTRTQLKVLLGRTPSIEEIAEAIDMHPDTVMDIMRSQQEILSLDEPLGDDTETVRGDIIADSDSTSAIESMIDAQHAQETIQKALGFLSERERKVLECRYNLDNGGESRTLEEVGEQFDLTRERIRQIEARAMSKIRHPSVNGLL